MGFLSRFLGDESVPTFEHPGEITVDPAIASKIPDPAKFLLKELKSDFGGYIQKAEMVFNGARHKNGSLPYSTRPKVDFKPSAGPIYLLNRITSVEDLMVVDVWASYNLRGAAKSSMHSIASDLVRAQGIPATATWVLSQRGDEIPGIDFLSQKLLDDYVEMYEELTYGDVLDALKS